MVSAEELYKSLQATCDQRGRCLEERDKIINEYEINAKTMRNDIETLKTEVCLPTELNFYMQLFVIFLLYFVECKCGQK